MDLSVFVITEWATLLADICCPLTPDGQAISATISGQGGGRWLPTPSLNLNRCLSDLLLIVNLQTHPRSTRIQIRKLSIFVKCTLQGVVKLWCLTDFIDM